MSDTEDWFDQAFRRRSSALELRPQKDDDTAFVHHLAARCSPLGAIVDPRITEQQAAFQDMSHRATYPQAMRRIVTSAGQRIGRIVVNWGSGKISHGIDIAVLPEFRSTGAGLHMLRAWLVTADSGNWTCTLDVNRDNPVFALYRRLGFCAEDGASVHESSPFLRMRRRAIGHSAEAHSAKWA